LVSPALATEPDGNSTKPSPCVSLPRVKRSLRIRAVASALLLGTAAVALFDGCGGAPAPRPTAPPWMGSPVATATPSAAPRPVELPVEPLLAADVAPGEAVFDPNQIVAVIDDPRLTVVKAHVRRGALKGAADELASALRGAPPKEAAEIAAWTYQLGRLRLDAGDPMNAIRAFERAAAIAWPLSDEARYHAARLLVGADQPGEAIAHLDQITAVDRGMIELVRARALAKQRDVDGAAAIWERYVARRPRGWEQVAMRMVGALLNQPSEARAERAVKMCRQVLEHSPSRRWSTVARQQEGKALATLPHARRKVFTHPDVAGRVELARILAWSGQGREGLKAADDAIDELEGGVKPADELLCEAYVAKGKALEVLGRDQEASDAMGEAIAKCQGRPRQVVALFVGGRAALEGGEPSKAGKRLADLERLFPKHRYADDARKMRAQAAKNLGDVKTYTRLLSTIGDDYPEGDTVDDALFELASSRILDGDWAGAIRPLEKAIALKRRGRPYWAEGRPQYYLARARIELGAGEQGVNGLAGVIRDFPLSYYAVLAYSRLRDRAPDQAQQVVARAAAAEPAGQLVIPDHAALHRPGFLRAVELVRQGDGERAVEELDALGVRKGTVHPSLVWASAFLLARIESPSESHGLLRSQGQLWREHHPAGVWRSVWEVAYPQPFAEVVAKETTRSGIPPHLAYAIIREESAFKTRAVSRAGAYGLMQLILPTAQRVARKLNLPSTKAALRRPEVNIALGCRYLSMGMHRFGDLPIMTVPGYNAGPGAPARWIKQRPTADFDLWVEQIPYRETRHYTKRVIQSMAAYATLYGKGLEDDLMRLPVTVETQSP